MKAITRTEYGSADNLRFEEVPMPAVDDTRVLVKVRASSVNPYDWHYVRGEPYLLRMSSGYRRPKDPAVGLDVAGTVAAVGAKVTRFQPGDEVFGCAHGAFAEYVVAMEKRLAPKPQDLSFESAASLPCAGVTALQAIRDKGGVATGMSVLVNGASGGVGSFSVQIARSLGAEVTGVCSTRNLELVREIGAAHVVDYTRDDFARQAQRYDVVVDTIGNRSLGDLRRALTPRGTLVVAGGAKGRWFRPVALLLKVAIVSPLVRQELRGVLAEVTPENLEALADLVVKGAVTPVVDRTCPLSELPQALAYVEEGHARGKVLITV